MKKVEIPAPQFDVYQTVMITWNGEHEVKVLKRWFDFEDESWWYEFSGWKGKYPQQMMYRPLALSAAQRQ